jgi:SAM-dependent methyltransferase
MVEGSTMSRLVKVYDYILNHPRTRRGYWGEWYFSERYDKVLNTVVEYYPNLRSVLEIGCGKGFYASLLQKLRPNCSYFGLDLDKITLKEAFKNTNTNYAVCDAAWLPVRDYSADLVLCSEVLEHLNTPYEVLSSLPKISRMGVIITFPVEHLSMKLRTMHPEHVICLEWRAVVTKLVQEGMTILRSEEIARFFLPCGIVEFLPIPKNKLTESLMIFMNAVLKKMVPLTLVPNQVILIVASKKKK